MNHEMYDNPQHLAVTFNRETLPEYLLQAQFAELVELKKIIHELSLLHSNNLYKVLDIGIGDARILKHLSGIKEMRNVIDFYTGIDVAQSCVDISNNQIQLLGISHKAKSILLNAQELDQLHETFDIIISTWFTAGNFYPSNYDAERFIPGSLDMSSNDTFTTIFQKAYERLNSGGEIIIGSVYIDNNETRLKQQDAYRYFGRNVITDQRDCFAATENGRRSQRFTKERIYQYLPFVTKENIIFTPLDTYDFAMMVRIKK